MRGEASILSRVETLSINVFVERVAEEFAGSVEPRLATVADEDARILFFLAWLSTRMEEAGLGWLAVIRGFVVEFYTGAAVRTFDVDLHAEGRAAKAAWAVLERLGERSGRGFVVEALRSGRPIEFATTDLRDFATVEVDGYRLRIWTPEAALAYLAAAWKRRGSDYDEKRARILWGAMGDRMDPARLCRNAAVLGAADAVNRIVGGEVCGGAQGREG